MARAERVGLLDADDSHFSHATLDSDGQLSRGEHLKEHRRRHGEWMLRCLSRSCMIVNCSLALSWFPCLSVRDLYLYLVVNVVILQLHERAQDPHEKLQLLKHHLCKKARDRWIKAPYQPRRPLSQLQDPWFGASLHLHPLGGEVWQTQGCLTINLRNCCRQRIELSRQGVLSPIQHAHICTKC